jgi:hypothetical protein
VVSAIHASPALTFWHWFSFSTYDYGRVEMRVGNGPWQILSGTFTGPGPQWTFYYVPLSTHGDSTIQIAFFFHAHRDIYGGSVSSGWYVDDVSIIGIGPVFSPNKTSIPFGIIGRNQSKNDTLRVTNTGGDTLRISSVVSQDPRFVVNPTNATIAPSQALDFVVTFTPPVSGFYNSKIVFRHNAAGDSTLINVSGRAWDKIVWHGTQNGAWSNPQNWSRNDTVGAVPAPTDSVIIPGGVPNNPVKAAGLDYVGALNIHTGGMLTLVDPGRLVVNNSLVVDNGSQFLIQSSAEDSIGGDVVLNGRIEVGATSTPAIRTSRSWIRGGASEFIPGGSVIPFSGVGTVSGNFNSIRVELGSVMTSTANLAVGNKCEVRNTLSLRQSLATLATDTLFIQRADSTALTGEGKVETGTIKRSIIPGVAARYRFESDSTYIRLRGSVPGLTSLTMTTFKNLMSANFGENIILIPTIRDTINNVMRTDSLYLTPNRRWVIFRPPPTGNPLLDTTAILRAYAVSAEGASNFRVAAAFRYNDSEKQRVREGNLNLYWVDTIYTGVESLPRIPELYSLDQNYPNPFNPTTTIRYALPAQSAVSLKVYNILGQEIKSLVSESQVPGSYAVQWNGTNNHGLQVSTGIYFYRLEVNGIGASKDRFTQVKKMLLIK